MVKLNATWDDLYEHIAKMSEEERKMPVLIWGEDRPLCKEVGICIDNEDMCYDLEFPGMDVFCGATTEVTRKTYWG